METYTRDLQLRPASAEIMRSPDKAEDARMAGFRVQLVELPRPMLRSPNTSEKPLSKR
jgi:hypothetical protein